MERRISIVGGVIATLLFGVIGVAGATSATAGGTAEPVPPTTQTVEANGTFSATATSVSAVATSVTVKGRTVLTVLGPSVKVRGKCIVTKVPLTKPPKGYTCMILPKGIPMVEDGYNVGNTAVRYDEVTRTGRQTFYWDGHGWRDAFCRNHVWFHKHVPPSAIILVKTTANLALNVKVHVAVAVTGSVGVICRIGDNWATATGSGSASASADVVVTVRASSFALLRAYVAAHKVAIASSITASVNAKASANALVNGGASCHVTITTPPNQPPVVSIINPPQHVIVNDYVRICASAVDPDGQNLTVSFSAIYGTTSTAFRPDAVGSPQQWCTWYTATADPHDAEVVTVTASDGSLSASASTPPFPIAPSPGF